MNSNWIFGIIIVLAAAILASFFLTKKPTTGTNSASDTRELKTYYDERYGIAFNFPDSYAISDRDPAAKHHTIVLVDKVASASMPAESDGPPAVTIDIFSTPTTLLADKWIKNTQDSNYKLSGDTALATTSVNGIPAFAYPWSGLYQATSIVFPHAGRIYMMSVTFNSQTDLIVKDFAAIVASVQLDP